MTNAKVAQLVERDLAKVEVAGSNPVFRSTRKAPLGGAFFVTAGMVELVDTPDLDKVECAKGNFRSRTA